MSAEENSPVDCFRRRGQGAKRREGARECAEKIPNSPPKWKAGHKACFLLLQNKKGVRTRREQTCLRKKAVRWTVFADVIKERSDAKAYGSMPKKKPNSPPKKACKQASLQAFFLTTSSKSLHTFDCFPSAAEIHRFRQSHTVYHSTCRR